MEKLVYRIDEIPPQGLEFELAPDPALYGIDGVQVTYPPGVSGWIRVLKERRELAVSGEVRAVLEAPCNRCLAPSACNVAGEFSFRMIPEGKGPEADEMELTSGELEVGFYAGDEVDLRRIIAEQIYLNVPLSILCRPECRGLCPQCGQDLNAADCGHRADSMDARWNALQELKKNLGH